MRTFKNVCAQGDVLFRKVENFPENECSKVKVGNKNELIITHSETGHNHVMTVDNVLDRPSVELFNHKDNPLLAWIKVNKPTVLEHLRSFDTHEPIKFDEGVYEIRRQREYVAEGFRKAQD